MRILILFIFLGFLPFTCLFSAGTFTILSETGGKDSLKNLLLKKIDERFKGNVFIWMNTECPICQKYPLVWNKLARDFPSFTFTAVFTSYEENRMAKKFIRKYNLPFQWFIDKENKLATYLKVTTTPEIIFVDANAKIIYRGATDDWFYALGKNKPVPQQFYLKNALMAFLNNQPVVTFQTDPIGCIFSY